ncbi:MAG TPA: biotin carboxylase N-terminal domain-containing protein [Mycobacterium sp.]|nr:biotin carboxylase N-terminal domain-containing protein [Mycobacterium sp.]
MSARPITKLLIANRGEIAVRIARTAHRLGIGTVGVYSEPDADAVHAECVDKAVALGGSSPAESYLRGDAIIAAAHSTGCDAIHPGYGFLAENASFARDVITAGLTWVGPTPEQIALLGDKISAKTIAVAAGVPTTEIVELRDGRVPDGIGLPVLIKAAAGGGGRGMRVVSDPADLSGAVEAASREALAAFGDATVFLEPYIVRGRHVEVQILGDGHGNVLHFFDRECSIQRRNQKIVEEAPAPGIDDATRQRLCAAAVALARHVGYQGAGTVEFFVGDDGVVVFLEVNTRLQVEHPVTEAITGVDLVELQLLVAAGEPLPLTQADIAVDGHAIETRVVAEDPAAGWLPCTGVLEEFDIPADVRVDSGVRAGSVISPNYDSLLAKVIAHAPSRAGAAGILARALRGSRISGVQTNAATVTAILAEPDYLAAATYTSYLDEHPEVLTAGAPEGDDRIALLLGAVFAAEQDERKANRCNGFAPTGWRNLATRGQRQQWSAGETQYWVEYSLTGNSATVLVGDPPTPDERGDLPGDSRARHRVRLLRRGADVQVIELDGCRRTVHVMLADDGATAHTSSPAGALTWRRVPRFQDHDADEGGGGPRCPLPGTVVALHVSAGDRVGEGDCLMVVEAMKMEHKIIAAAPGVVEQVCFGVGDRVDEGDLLVALRAAEQG